MERVASLKVTHVVAMVRGRSLVVPVSPPLSHSACRAGCEGLTHNCWCPSAAGSEGWAEWALCEAHRDRSLPWSQIAPPPQVISRVFACCPPASGPPFVRLQHHLFIFSVQGSKPPFTYMAARTHIRSHCGHDKACLPPHCHWSSCFPLYWISTYLQALSLCK